MLDGELVVGLQAEIGYVHTGIEKNIEQKTYWKAITYVPRMDYLSFFNGETAFCMAIEKALDLEVPRRAEWIRVLFQELNRIHSHLIFLGTGSVDLGGIALLFYCFRDRDLRARPVRDGHRRSACTRATARSAASARTCRAASSASAARSSRYMRKKLDEYDGPDRGQPDLARAHRAASASRRRTSRIQMGLSGPNLRASGIPYDLRTAQRRLRRVPRDRLHAGRAPRRRRLRRASACASRRCAPSLDVIEKVLDGMPDGPVHLGRPQGRAAAAPRAAHLDGVADPPLQAGDRGLPRPGRAGLRRRSSRRAASSASTSSPTAAPSRGAPTCAARASSACSRSARSARATTWPT